MAMQKADKFMMAADKKASKFDWFGISKQQNQEDAAEMYAKAAAQYKIIKEYGKAGLCYSKSAQCNMAAQNDIEAKASWREAGKCYRHVDFKKAIEAYKNAIQLNLDADRFGQAARLQEEIGDMLADDEHFDEAINAYEQSADYYEAENDTGNKNKRLLKVAHMCGKPDTGRYQKAIKIFENIAKASADNNLLRWKVKEYIFKAMLLNIAMLLQDQVEKKKNIKWPDAGQTINERYCDISDIYASSRECKLIVKILQCIPSESAPQEFSNAVGEHDRICKLERWSMDLASRIKELIEQRGQQANEDDVLNELGVGGDGGGGGYDDNDEKEKEADKQENANTHNPFQQGQANDDAFKDAPDADFL